MVEYFYRRYDRKSGLKASIRRYRRRTIERNAIGSHTEEELLDLLNTQESRCGYCGIPLTKYHLDHMMPLSKGGTNYIDNLLFTCPTCNWSKNDKTYEEYLRYLNGYTTY